MERRLFERRSRASVCPPHPGSGIWLSSRERFVASRKRAIAPPLDATHYNGPQIDRGVWQGINRVSLPSQSQNTDLCPATRQRGGPGGQQSFEHRASCRTGSTALQGKYSDRDVWQEHVSTGGRPALSAHSWALSVLLVSAATNLSECRW